MSFDYSGLLSTAQELIAFFGRDVTLERRSSASASPTRPWGAPATSGADVLSVIVKAAFLDTAKGADANVSVGISGGGQTSITGKTSRVLVAAQASITIEAGPEFHIIDNGRRWEVTSAKTIKPGGTMIYYDLQVTA